MRLHAPTPAAWTTVVLADFDTFLLDHASCERKASASALSFMTHYRDRSTLVEAMIELAREELEHFAQVYFHIAARGLVLAADTKDTYIGQMAKLTRSASATYLLDRLLIAGVIEARGCERFGLVANALPAGILKDFYLDITRSEARHHGLFVRLARAYYEEAEVALRLEEILASEASIMLALPLRPVVH